MFRNQYDSDVTIWSPQGRLHQVKSLKAQLIEIKMLPTKHLLKVEYAMEAVKQGSATVGVKSNTHAVLVALKRASSELSRYKVGSVDELEHLAVLTLPLSQSSEEDPNHRRPCWRVHCRPHC